MNYIDTYLRTGLYASPLPFTPGREGAGVVERVGEKVSEFKIGDRVAFFSPGSYAEYAAVPESKLARVPEGVELKTAAAVFLQGLTAHYLTHTTFSVQQGHTALVLAGAGGTGGLVVQMARQRGARVIATVSTKEKAAAARALGAHEVVNYAESDFREEVLRLTNGQGVDVVYDGVGKATWERSLKSLKPLGFLVLFGNSSGAVPPIDPLALSAQGSISMCRPSLVNYIATPQALRERAADLFGMISKGELQVRVDAEFPLEKAAESHAYLESRKALGKILLRP